MNILLRRKKLGKTSCEAISKLSRHGIAVLRNDKPWPAGVDLVIRWGCTSNTPTKNVLNTAEAIHLVGDKSRFRRVLDEKQLCPKTFWADILDPGELYFPSVVRPAVHHQGRHCYLVTTPLEFTEAVRKCGPGWYASAFIDKVAEYRVFIVQGRVVAVAQKTPGNPEDIAWNVARGGRFDNVKWDDWPMRAVRVSVEAFMLSGLDFGGVDVMVDRDGKAYILEINSAPSLTSPYRQECFAKAFDYILDHGKAPIPLSQERVGYKKFIHPSICQEAWA